MKMKFILNQDVIGEDILCESPKLLNLSHRAVKVALAEGVEDARSVSDRAWYEHCLVQADAICEPYW